MLLDTSHAVVASKRCFAPETNTPSHVLGGRSVAPVDGRCCHEVDVEVRAVALVGITPCAQQATPTPRATEADRRRTYRGCRRRSPHAQEARGVSLPGARTWRRGRAQLARGWTPKTATAGQEVSTHAETEIQTTGRAAYGREEYGEGG